MNKQERLLLILIAVSALYVIFFNSIFYYWVDIDTGICLDCNQSKKLDYLINKTDLIMNRTTDNSEKIKDLTNTVTKLKEIIDKQNKTNAALNLFNWLSSLILIIIAAPAYLLFKKNPNIIEKRFISFIKKYKYPILLFLWLYLIVGITSNLLMFN